MPTVCYKGGRALAKYKRIITAGPLVVEAVYPAPYPRDSAAVRAGKHRLTSEAQKRMNLKYSWQKLELEIAANFGPRDLYCTFTYDNDHLPGSRAEAIKRIKAFWRKLRAARTGRRLELRYLYVTEHKHGDGRWHHHVLINGTGHDYDQIRELWGQGNVDFVQLRVDKEKNYESLAKYLCKEQRDKLGHRLWSGSRNLKKPEAECFRVPDETDIAAPKKAVVIADAQEQTAYGHYHYLKYLAKGWLTASRPPYAKRRRANPRP